MMHRTAAGHYSQARDRIVRAIHPPVVSDATMLHPVVRRQILADNKIAASPNQNHCETAPLSQLAAAFADDEPDRD